MTHTGRLRRHLALAVTAALATAGLAVLPTSAAAAVDDDLLLSYDFAQTTGTTVPDASGNGHAGTIAGVGATVSGDVLTLPGGAHSANPGYVQLPTGVFDGHDTLTISTWLRNETAAGNFSAMFFGSAASTPAQYWLLNPRNPAGRVKSVLTNGSAPSAPWGTEYGISPTNAGQGVAGPVTPTGWAQYTTVITPTSISGYVNGSKIGTVPTTRTVSQFGTGLVGYIGRSSYPDPRYKGGVRDVEVYTTAKTDAEIRDDYWSEADPAVRDAALAADAAAIVVEPRTVTADVTLPTLGVQGSAISWASSDPARVSASGVVTRPTDGADASVTLTATLTLGGATTTREFGLTVRAVNAQADLVALAERLVLAPTLVAGEALPTAEAGASVTYAVDAAATSTAGVGVANGALTTTAAGPVAATVTATLTNDAGTASVDRVFDVTVLPAAAARFLRSSERTPLAAATYGPKMAYSLHLGLGADRSTFTPLNGNDGVLFAKAVPSGTLDIVETRTLRSPSVFELGGTGTGDARFGVVATRSLADGSDDASAASSFLLFTTPDLEHYTEVGTIGLGVTNGVNDPRAVWDSASELYRVTWRSDAGAQYSTTFTELTDAATRGPITLGGLGSLAGAAGTVLAVDTTIATALQNRFGRVSNTTVSVAEQTIEQGASVSLDGVRAELGYSDGSTATRGVTWNATDLAAVNTAVPGEYTVRGTVRQPDYARPFIPAEADPDILKWNGSYYFISTDDAGVGINARNMYLRKASTIEGLRTAADHSVAGLGGPTDIRGCFWAPELHEIGGTLAIFYAPCVGAASWTNVQAHVQTLKAGGDPTLAADWNAPQLVLKSTGERLQLDAAHPGISLDMTVFDDAGRWYAVWSQRYIAGATGDAELWIATIDPANPARLTSTPKKLVTSEYGWDTNTSNVAEGAYAQVRDGKVWLTYSGSNIDTTYAVGQLSAVSGADLTERSNWVKANAAVLNSNEAINELGPGHNSFTTDEDGNTLLVYHAKSTGSSFRDTYLRTVHWAADGRPLLDLTNDELVAPANRSVSVTITVEAAEVPPLEVEVTASTRCVAGKVVLTVQAKNTDAAPLALGITSPHGSKSFAAVAPGASGSAAFTTRLAAVPAGEVTVTATATPNGVLVTTPVTAAFAPRTCG